MQKKSIFVRNFSSLFYSVAITMGIYISINELHKFNNISNFIIFSFAILVIYCVELFTTFQNKSSKVEINFDIEDEINELSHFFHKLILPILLYFSLVSFGYFNFEERNFLVILAVTFFAFFILFINTKAFLLNMQTIEHKTHYVYDVIKFLIFFLLINVLGNAYTSMGVNIAFLSVTAGVISFGLLALMVWRINKLRKKSIFYSLILSFIIGGLFAGFNLLLEINPLQLSLSLIFLFYVSTAIIHHKLMNTLTAGVISEYLIVILLVLAITYGIT